MKLLILKKVLYQVIKAETKTQLFLLRKKVLIVYNLGATSIVKIGEVRLSDEMGGEVRDF